MDTLSQSLTSDEIKKLNDISKSISKINRMGSQPAKASYMKKIEMSLSKQTTKSKYPSIFQQESESQLKIYVNSPKEKTQSTYACLTSPKKKRQLLDINIVEYPKSEKGFDEVLPLLSQKSEQGLNRRKERAGVDQSQYYLYWKNKANEYQEQNVKLLRINSELSQQLQKLKQENEKQKEKLKFRKQQKQLSADIQLIGDLKKSIRSYEVEIVNLRQVIRKQEIIILTQNSKIQNMESLSDENKKLKVLLQNFESIVSTDGKPMSAYHSFSKGKSDKIGFGPNSVDKSSPIEREHREYQKYEKGRLQNGRSLRRGNSEY